MFNTFQFCCNCTRGTIVEAAKTRDCIHKQFGPEQTAQSDQNDQNDQNDPNQTRSTIVTVEPPNEQEPQ